jgi:hypothetical protein
MLKAMRHAALTQADVLEALRSVIIGTGSSKADSEEPQWENWVAPVGLSVDVSQVLVSSLRRLWLLPFADRSALAGLLLFRHTRLPRVREQAQRLEQPELVLLINELYSTWGLLHNFFYPNLKLLSKTRKGCRTIRKPCPPQTPYLRLIRSEHLSPNRSRNSKPSSSGSTRCGQKNRLNRSSK